MELLITGVARYRAISGFGPLKRERWEEKKFEVTMGAGDRATPVSELEVRCVPAGDGLALEGTLRRQPCYFADFANSLASVRKNITMVSVSGIELQCRVETVPDHLPIAS